jgi:hypothetical protein
MTHNRFRALDDDSAWAGLFLAAGAEVGAAAADDDSAHGPAAAAAREGVAAVDLVFELKMPGPAFGIDVVPDG